MEAFRYRLLREPVSYLFYRDQKTLAFSRSADSASMTGARREWVLAWPDAFPLAYRNEEEATAIFGVRPDAHFVEAYALYLDALRFLEKSEWTAGMAKLNQAIQRYPSLASAHNALGVALMLQGHFSNQAEKELRMAARLRPGYRQPLYNLARLHEKTGRSDLARECLARADQENRIQ